MMGATAILGAAVGLQAIGQVTQGMQAQQAAQFNARVAENNARLQDNLALDAARRGQIEEQRSLLDAGRLRSRQAAALAANGVDISSGSPLQTLADTAALGRLDGLQVRANAEREVFSRQLAANDARVQASLNRAQGRSALTQSAFNAGGSLLTAGSLFA
ncbi:MAG: hypothetical protein AAFY02_13890 [Pseudomonadota bacterium]